MLFVGADLHLEKVKLLTKFSKEKKIAFMNNDVNLFLSNVMYDNY